ESDQRRKAEEAEADMKAFATFLARYVLAATRPEGLQHGVGVNVTMAEALEKAEPRIAEVFADRPRAEALARHEVGGTWRNLGRYPEAVRNLRRALRLRREALGPEAPETLDTMNSLGVAYGAAGQFERALALLEQTVALRKQQLGPDHVQTLSSAGNLAMAYH